METYVPRNEESGRERPLGSPALTEIFLHQKKWQPPREFPRSGGCATHLEASFEPLKLPHEVVLAPLYRQNAEAQREK